MGGGRHKGRERGWERKEVVAKRGERNCLRGGGNIQVVKTRIRVNVESQNMWMYGGEGRGGAVRCKVETGKN